MKKIYLKPTTLVLVILGLCVTHFSFSQSVSINTTGAAAHGSAGLDVNFSDKGVLIPRVKLTATNVVAPISTTPTTSLLVFNTNTAGSGATQVTPGYYYWAGEWKRLIDSDDLAGSFWKINGNSGTTITNNFIGTTDNNGLMVRTNNANRFEFNTSGQILSNTTGTASAPTYGWRSSLTNGTNTGMFRSSSTRLGFTVAGAHILDLLSAADGSKQLLSQVNGTANRPFYSFEGSVYSGMWSPGANIIAFSTNQQERLRFNTTEAIFNNANQNYNFRVRTHGNTGTTGTHTFFVRSSDSRIGIRTSTPDSPLHMINGATTIADATGMAHFELSSINGFAVYGETATNYQSRATITGVNRSTDGGWQNAAMYALSIADGYYMMNIGIQGATNGYDAYAVYGTRYDPYGDGFGFAGLFLGRLGYSGGAYAVSDRRLKKDVKPITGALAIVNKLNPVTYLYDTDHYPNMGLSHQLEYGLIAQEVQEVLPTVVNEGLLPVDGAAKHTLEKKESTREKFFMMDYTRLIPITIEAIKEQQEIIQNQEDRIKQLEKIVIELQEKLDK